MHPGLGYGFGFGDGDGYGDGYGGGYGYGDGYGDGSGFGDGSGYGFGDGSGSGYGDGDGFGDGSGSGYGDGDGSGSKRYLDAVLKHAASTRLDALKAAGAVLAFWRSGPSGCPTNHPGDRTPRSAGAIEHVQGPLLLCSKRALHATLNPAAWRGDRLWVVALYPPVETDGDTLGSLKREIVCEIPNFYK